MGTNRDAFIAFRSWNITDVMVCDSNVASFPQDKLICMNIFYKFTTIEKGGNILNFINIGHQDGIQAISIHFIDRQRAGCKKKFILY